MARARRASLPALSLLAVAVPLALVTCATRAKEASPRRPSPADAGALPTPVTRTDGAAWRHDWARGAVFYEVFVRSFSDSDGDGKGDLAGLVGRLDYLNDGDPATANDLGVDGLWLMPVFESPSYHGYDTVDYETIERDYGSNADFRRLLSEAHRRGLKVIVDFVMNHTSADHPWFVDSASSPASKKRDWYVWSDTDPGWKQPWGGTYGTWHLKNGAYYYGLFWSGMPDLNFRAFAVREEMKRLASFWLERGVDGFRLDATRHLVETGAGAGQSDAPETHAFLRELSQHVRRVKPDAVLVGENWTETPVLATYFGSAAAVAGGDELPLNFNFPLAEAIVQGVNAGQAAPVAAKLDEMRRLYPAGVVDAPFLTNHDQRRLADQLGKSAGRLRNAAAVLLTLPGMPFLYYGEEVGIENGPGGGDEAKRTPMPWDASPTGGFSTGTPWYPFAPGRETANVASQTNDPGSLLSRYRSLLRARKASNALAKGSLTLLSPTSGVSPVLAYFRTSGSERVLVAHNLSDGFVSGGPYAVGAAGFTSLFSDPSAVAPSPGPSVTVNLGPRASGVWRVD